MPLGTVVGGKYRLESVIGFGGMGIVYAATHLVVGQGIALKVLRGPFVSSVDAQRRFLREARATFALRSAHTVRLLDVDQIEPLGLVMVMELLDGENLRQIIQARAPMPIDESLAYAAQAAEALAEAHERGIVHRDIKPANLFVTLHGEERWIKVLDFGLAKALEGEVMSAPLTAPRTTLGTPRYMAPEQWSNPSGVDGRTDIYSLGIVLYQMLTGTVPFGDVPTQDRAARILASPAPSPRALRPDIPEAVARIVTRMLRPIPEDRFADAYELAEALRDPLAERDSFTMSTAVGKRAGRSTAPTVTEEATPATEREPNWELATTPKAKPSFDAKVYTGTAIHDPSASGVVREVPRPTIADAVAPSSASPFALSESTQKSVERPLAVTLPSASEPISPFVSQEAAVRAPASAGAAKLPQPPARVPTPLPARVPTPLPVVAPKDTAWPTMSSTTSGLAPVAKGHSARAFLIATAVAFVIGVALAFLVYMR